MKIYFVADQDEKLLSSLKKFIPIIQKESIKKGIEVEIIEKPIIDLKVDAIVSPTSNQKNFIF
jgi:hypothetical protein